MVVRWSLQFRVIEIDLDIEQHSYWESIFSKQGASTVWAFVWKRAVKPLRRSKRNFGDKDGNIFWRTAQRTRHSW
jgi:hypothetical protein